MPPGRPASFTTCSAGALSGPDFCLTFPPSKGYDDPEILPSSIHQICLIGADAGHFRSWKASLDSLLAAIEETGLPLQQACFDWIRRGTFMHTINHPKDHVLVDVAMALARKAGLETRNINPTEFLVDSMGERGGVWPVYPMIAERRGIAGNYLFRASSMPNTKVVVHNLEQFVTRSFGIYAEHPRTLLNSRRVQDGRYEKLLKNYRPPVSTKAVSKPKPNPYKDLPAHHYWRRSISNVSISEFDPVVSNKFTLSREDKIATAGSCFAQHISKELVRRKCTYYVAEQGPATQNFGVFSARFGNLYTVRQLLQLFDRAYGWFSPDDDAWDHNGAVVDPFRPQVEPAGFVTVDALLSNRRIHLSAVREMFENLDVFVFTLGLTEAWRSKSSGAVFPLAPGVSGGAMDETRYEFVNFTTTEIEADLRGFIDRLHTVNSDARIIFTVSPVPLVATFENRHVLVSTTESKARLRAAVGQVTKIPSTSYFPSYEIITGNYNKGSYFADDLREVRPEGVAHVMRIFMRHYFGNQDSVPVQRLSSDAALRAELGRVSDVVCDEEALDSRWVSTSSGVSRALLQWCSNFAV